MKCPKCGEVMSYTHKDEWLQEHYRCPNGHTATK